MSYAPTLENHKKESAEIARDLCYGCEVISKIWAAQSINEVDRILHDARLGKE